MKRPMTTICWFAVAALFAVCGSTYAKSIVDSKHNLSASGPGPVKATTQTEICIFCHTPHNARSDIPYLWNRQDPAGPYTPYYSSTLKASVGQPTGASRLCLSCHDGTIAPGAVLSQPVAIPFTLSMAGRSSNLGTNLADDHPVSLDYAAAAAMANSQLAAANTLPPAVRLDHAGQMQCTACHNPHNDQNGMFLVVSNQGSALCIACHKKTGWTTNSHATSVRTWNGSGTDPWPRSDYTTVAQNACGSCHRPHAAPGQQRLLNYAVEETNCLVCHNGNVATKNIEADLNKTYRHPVAATTGVHDPAENYGTAVVTKHVECTDCHNPHQVNSAIPGAPLVPGRLAGVAGVDFTTNAFVASSVYEYQICFKCHGALTNNVLKDTPYAIPRVYNTRDNRNKFSSANPSFHPLMAPLNKISDNMLVAPWAKGAMIYCTDCHGSDSSSIRGSHGSIYPHILVAKYETSAASPATFNAADYALCFKCHNLATLTGTFTKFRQHKTHLQTHAVKDRCTYCHDPHGNPTNEGMINFDLRVVSQNGANPIRYKPPVTSRKSCDLVCHGTVHGP